MFHPCSLAKVICVDVKSDEWFMRHLREKAVNFYNVLNRTERRARRQAGRVGGRERSAGKVGCHAVGRGPLSHTVWAPASHLHWHHVCISLWYPAISPPRAHSRPERQQSWQTQYPVTALSNASYSAVEYVCVSVWPCFAIFVRASLHFRPSCKGHCFYLRWFWCFVLFLFINLRAGWKHYGIIWRW